MGCDVISKYWWSGVWGGEPQPIQVGKLELKNIMALVYTTLF